jgi:hypothetical protein
MVEEPTKMLRGALAFLRGASCSIKTRDPIRDWIGQSISPSGEAKSMQQTKIRQFCSDGRASGE